MRLTIPAPLVVANVRHLTCADYDAYIATERDAEVKKYVGGANPKRHAEMLKDLVEKFTPSLRLMAIADPIADTYMGRCGLMVYDSDRLEMHCVIAKEYWGKGIGRRVFQLLAQLSKQEGKAPVAIVDPNNQSSRGILESIGFAFEGIENHVGSYQNGHLRYAESVAS